MEIRELKANEVETALFAGFDRFQEVTKCWQKIKGADKSLEMSG